MKRFGRPADTGFSLVELMIVVAIIGLLAAIAVPSFLSFNARARQAEAKAGLKGYFTAAKSTFSETMKWTCEACGWEPESGGVYIYNYYLSPNTTFTNSMLGCDESSIYAALQSNPSYAIGEPGGFTAGATANIDADPQCDGWNINDANLLTNTFNDVDN